VRVVVVVVVVVVFVVDVTRGQKKSLEKGRGTEKKNGITVLLYGSSHAREGLPRARDRKILHSRSHRSRLSVSLFSV
jgi:hypothetical protein